MITVGSLFSGIGGLDLGLERAGMEIKWHSEIDPYGCKILKRHWPEIPNLGNIKEIDWTKVEPVDVIAGGYPCQPFSLIGERRGKEDPRHLWPYFADAIRTIRPRFALLENVSGHLSMGFGDVLGDLAEMRYDARWDCVPAAAVGAPHLRDRVFVIATRREMAYADEGNGGARQRVVHSRGNEIGFYGREMGAVRSGYGQVQSWPRPRIHWATEPDVCRVVDGIPHRMDRIAGLGNAVVPQVAEYMGNIIKGMAS